MGYTYGGSGGRSSSSFTGASPGNYGNGYVGPINFGTTQYQQGQGASQANPWGGDAGIRATNFGTTPSYQMPSFGNTMGGGNAFGGTGGTGMGPFGNTMTAGTGLGPSWNAIAAGTRANQNPTMFAGGTPSLWGGANNSGMWGGSGGGGWTSSGFNSPWDPQGVGYAATQRLASPSPSYGGFGGGNAFGGGGVGLSGTGAYQTAQSGGRGGISDLLSGMAGSAYQSQNPYGVLPSMQATWPNPGATAPAYVPSNRYSTSDMLAGLYPGELPGTNNPYTMLPGAMNQLAQWGTPMPAPTNPVASRNAAEAYVGGIQRNYNLPYAEQVATAYGPAGISNVNRGFSPSIAGSTPYLRNVSQNPSQNQTPQAYLYGNPATGYPGVMAGMRTSAGLGSASAQFQQAATGGANNSGLWGR